MQLITAMHRTSVSANVRHFNFSVNQSLLGKSNETTISYFHFKPFHLVYSVLYSFVFTKINIAAVANGADTSQDSLGGKSTNDKCRNLTLACFPRRAPLTSVQSTPKVADPVPVPKEQPFARGGNFCPPLYADNQRVTLHRHLHFLADLTHTINRRRETDLGRDNKVDKIYSRDKYGATETTRDEMKQWLYLLRGIDRIAVRIANVQTRGHTQ